MTMFNWGPTQPPNEPQGPQPFTRERWDAVLTSLVPPEYVTATGHDRLSIPAQYGAQTLAEVLRRLDISRIPLADIALRRPSLDDVFLALTGQPAEESKEAS